MSVAALIDSIGLISSGLGIVGFIQDNIPGEKPPEGAAVRIKVGLEKGDDEGQLDGNIAAVYAWDTNNNYLGQGDGADVAAGDVYDVTVGQSVGGIRAEFVGLSGGNDAICISWVTVNMKDSTVGGAWTGDIGYSCGQAWYEQAELAGYIDKNGPRDDTNAFIPHCSWLDGDHTNDIPSAAMKFRTVAYGDSVTETNDKGTYCDATKFGPDTGPITDAPAGKRAATVPIHKRDRPQWIMDRLVVSNLTQHRAANLCSSETSWGPDFIGSDGMFCDMQTKTLTPLCSAQDVNGCLNVDSLEKRVTKRTTVAKRQMDLVHKDYKRVDNWGL